MIESPIAAMLLGNGAAAAVPTPGPATTDTTTRVAAMIHLRMVTLRSRRRPLKRQARPGLLGRARSAPPMRPAVSRHEPPASHSGYQAPGATSRRRRAGTDGQGAGGGGRWAKVGAVPEGGDDALLDLVPVVRRVVAARIRDPQLVEDLVQETLVRMAPNRSRVELEALAP